jgi:HNH endonuclease
MKIVVQCETCKTDYEVWPYRKDTSRFCSSTCRDIAPRPSRITSEQRLCWYCGTTFATPPCHDRNKKRTEHRVFCSRMCYTSYTQVALPCEHCGAEFVVQRYRLDKARFCGLPCYGHWLSEHQTGENHPNWKGGWEPYYGSDWYRQRDACRERDNYTCRACGIHSDDIGSQHMDVHHVVPYRLSRDNSLGNLVTLCDPCHHAVESHKIPCPEPHAAQNIKNRGYVNSRMGAQPRQLLLALA